MAEARCELAMEEVGGEAAAAQRARNRSIRRFDKSARQHSLTSRRVQSSRQGLRIEHVLHLNPPSQLIVARAQQRGQRRKTAAAERNGWRGSSPGRLMAASCPSHPATRAILCAVGDTLHSHCLHRRLPLLLSYISAPNECGSGVLFFFSFPQPFLPPFALFERPPSRRPFR